MRKTWLDALCNSMKRKTFKCSVKNGKMLKKNRGNPGTPKYKKMYQLRKETIKNPFIQGLNY